MEIGEIEGLVWAKKPSKIPVVFTRDEARRVIEQLNGDYKLMVLLLYGAGLRLMECLRLRVQDIDLGYNQITVRNGKGDKDRVTILPKSVEPLLKAHLINIKKIHDKDLQNGCGEVYLPYALEKKYPNANREWKWQYVFPATQISKDPRSGKERRHHIHESVLQRVVKTAIRKAGIQKHAGCHTFAP